MQKDYYNILGVSKNASDEEIKKAYRKLAHQHHPDKTGGDEKKFKEINEAYQILSNKEKRAQYDRFGTVFDGSGGYQPGGGFGFDPNNFSGFGFENVDVGDFGDVFEAIFDQFGVGRKKRETYKHGSDVEFVETITLEDAFRGLKKTFSFKTFVKCASCNGVGYDPSKGFSNCSTCRGKGEIRVDRKTFFGNFSQVKTCDVCFGKGEVPKEQCKSCKGTGRISDVKNVDVHIAPGIEDGQVIKISGGGEVGERGSGTGDLYLMVKIKPHSVFDRKKDDLFIKKEIKITDALLGKKIELVDVGGEKFSCAIPNDFNFDKPLKISGRGMTRLGSSLRGDLYIHFSFRTPKRVSNKAKQLLEDLDKEI